MTHTDDVRGVIVGGDHVMARLYYDGRPQGATIYACNEGSALDKARALKAATMAEMGQAAFLIFPNDAAWEMRIFD